MIADQPFSLTALMRRHKRASAVSIAVLAALIAFTVITAVVSGSRAGPLTDAATCSQWIAAPAAQRTDYSHLYLREYGVLPNTDPDAGVIERTINSACMRAAYLGEADDVSILAAIRHNF